MRADHAFLLSRRPVPARRPSRAAGQQPAPLGGPLYSLHKIATAVGIARTFVARTGVPCVPVFWVHNEDSDFAEIRSASVADPTLTSHEVSLPDSAHADGGLVGSI